MVQPPCISNQVTVRPPPPPPRGKAGNEMKPRPASASLPPRCGSGTPGSLRSVTSTRITPFAVSTATVSPGAPEPLRRILLTQRLVHEQCCHIPALVPRAKHPVHECAGDPRTLRPPRKRHGLPDRPSHQRNRPSPPAPARGSVRAVGRAHTGMHPRLGGARQAGHAASVARPWPSAESRRCTPTATTVHTDRRNCAHRPSLQHGSPSAMRPWTAQYDGLQRDKVTHAGTEKKRPASARICS